MANGSPSPALNPEMEDLKKQAEVMQTAYDELKNGIDDQTNRIQGNAQMLLKIMSDTPNQTNSVTQANVNMDDPSKTRIPKIGIWTTDPLTDQPTDQPKYQNSKHKSE